ncbi:MAG: YihY/virulence factor BrkB family protein [Bdellovibrio bacteriovorus]
MLNRRDWLRVPRNTLRLWLHHDAFSHAGALAFFALFSLAPTLIVAVAVIGVVLGEGAAQGEIVAQLQETIGPEAAGAIEQAVLLSRLQATGLIPTLLGVGALLIGATTVFGQLRASLNALWGVRPNPAANGLWQLARTRLLGLLVVLLIGLVLLLYFVLGTALSTIGHYLDTSLAATSLVMSGGQWLVSLLIAVLFIATLFKVLPDVILSWGDVWLGAMVTALMFAVGRYGIASFLAYTATASIYGAAASLVIVLFWIYYSALILLLGAAFTRALLEARGRSVVPAPGAVRVVQELVASEPA